MVFHHLMDLGLFPAWGYFEKSAMNICIHRESFFCLSKVMDQFWLLLHPALIPRRIYSSCYLPLSFVCLFVDLGFLLLLLFSRSVVSDPLWPRGLQHARFPWPSLPTPRAYSNSCPLSQWCHPTILSSVVPFSPCPQSFPASGSFQMSQLFISGGKSIRVSASMSFQGTPRTTQS